VDLLTADRSARRALLEQIAPGRQLLHVAILSGVGLFFELLLIRWLDAEIRPLAYVKNLPLIGSFLGLGIGFAMADRRWSTFPFSVLLLCLVLAVASIYASRFGTSLAGPAGPEINLGMQITASTSELVLFYLLIAGVFGLVVLAMIPLGQIAGEHMAGLPPLRCYSANVAGSLTGILLFSAAAALSIPPWASTALAFAVCLAYLRQPRLRAFSLVVAVATLAGMAAADRSADSRTVWSPYNKIKVRELPQVTTVRGREVDIGWVLGIQNGYYQRLLDLRPATVRTVGRKVPLVQQAAYSYNYPYRWVRPGSVLVVGAGTGNDVAAALRHGAEKVDAVEIDPWILRFGRELHPEQPYSDSRVRVIEADAREFLRRSQETYDLIVFGLLDSHSSLYSSLSNNIRLDNYVYTVEALKEAVDRLDPERGVLSLAFYVEQPWVAARLEAMLREVLGEPPLVTNVYYDDGMLYLAGPGAPEPGGRSGLQVGLPEEKRRAEGAETLARDDWPYLYLEKRGVPATILQASAGCLVVTLLLVTIFFRGQVRFDRHLFFLGAGFLLIETRTIAQLGLIFGSTWRVSAITIAGILALILVANALVGSRGGLPRLPLYVALGLCLVANYLVPPGIGVGGGVLAGAALASFYLLPLLFAALIFATSVYGLEGLAVPLASNFVGAVLGGLLENLSLSVGISALSLIAVLVYAASFRR
jgi:SAM-dependent methyltransferase